jgi:hypothetical protein
MSDDPNQLDNEDRGNLNRFSGDAADVIPLGLPKKTTGAHPLTPDGEVNPECIEDETQPEEEPSVRTVAPGVHIHLGGSSRISSDRRKR